MGRGCGWGEGAGYARRVHGWEHGGRLAAPGIVVNVALWIKEGAERHIHTYPARDARCWLCGWCRRALMDDRWELGCGARTDIECKFDNLVGCRDERIYTAGVAGRGAPARQ